MISASIDCTISNPALLWYLFVPAEPPRDERLALEAFLEAEWARCGQLGMTEAVPGLASTLPRLGSPSRSGFHVVAGRRGPQTDGIAEAYAFTQHDVVGLIACLGTSAEDVSVETWISMRERWSELASPEPPDAILGRALIFTGLSDQTEPARCGPLEAGVAAILPRLAGENCAVTHGPVQRGIELWEAQTRELDQWTLAVLAHRDTEADLDRWSWWRSSHESPALVSYLLQASRLNYETRVYERGIETIRSREQEMEDLLNAIVVQIGKSGHGDGQALLRAQAELTTLQAASTGLIVSMTRLREMKQTATILERNLSIDQPLVSSGVHNRARGPLSGFVENARWLGEALEHDLAYSQAVRDRADAVHNLTSLRLQDALAVQSRRQTRLTLIQTTVLGALVAAVGASQVFHLGLDPGRRLRVPAFVAFVALLVALPQLLTHWTDGYGPFDYVVTAFLGAALGALVQLQAWHSAPVGTVVIGAAAGAAIGLAALHQVNRAAHTKVDDRIDGGE